ncbi:MAG: dihydrolipoyl dehydrogenase [Deltaproteobacteria bacterium HGW-Deltaproteobacteria-6]|jgi:dihydrolipoamide dehydrogenase|nr:MAG: dihydrolipoyl dehydrogenase [Deltaproteobacteria bacterium HGW-Deltaproteobacteria-5]PKN16780.1 MAG: dihydrolipoyl dehydrogenase [Deltaproteobacteria bacterium HGW-Deltaproteobacteria-6]
MSDKYDLIVIGGGPGGTEAAQTASQKQKRVLIIEKNGWGGTCAHRGCIPTKAMLSCSKSYTDLKKLKRFGIHVDGITVDFMAMKKHRDQMVKLAALGAQKGLADAQVETKTGTGEILSPREVRYIEPSGQSHLLETKNILIAWGSEPQLLPDIKTSERMMTSDGILEMTSLPSGMIVVGGSFIGVEYATVFAELGVKVILVELLDRILPQEDQEAAEFLTQELARLGIAVHTSTELTSLKESAGGVVMQVRKNREPMEMRAGCALLCTGRKPLLYRTELDRLGIEYSSAGIKVDKNMMTTCRGIYAAGDVTGGMMLAHRAARQAKAAVEHMYGGIGNIYNENFIPSVVYSHPQIARVGYTEERARNEGLSVEVVRSPYSANIIARTELIGQGFVKAVFHQDKIIGAVILGDHAADLISGLALAVAAQLTRKQLRSWVIPHPTLSEIFAPLIG